MSTHSFRPGTDLPENPNLDQLKRQARELQRAFAERESVVREQVAAHVPHRAGAKALSLADAQCTIARGYGFSSWPRMKAHIEWLRRSPEERLDDAKVAVNPVGWTTVSELPDHEENLESLRHMLRREPELAHMRFQLPGDEHPDGDREWTLLHQAAWGNGLEMAELLIENGADPHATNAGGATPLAVALHYGHGREPLVKRLVDLGSAPDNLRSAAGRGDLERARALLAEGTGPDSAAGADREVWHRSYNFPERPILTGRQGILDDALGYAARSEQLPAMRWLLDEGADVNVIAYVGTALHWASFFGRLEAVRFLLDHGADLEIRDDHTGGAALNWAHVFGQASVVKLLIERGAQADLPND